MAIKKSYNNQIDIAIEALNAWESHVLQNLFDIKSFVDSSETIFFDFTCDISTSNIVRVRKDGNNNFIIRLTYTQERYNRRDGAQMDNVVAFDCSIRDLKRGMSINLSNIILSISRAIIGRYQFYSKKREESLETLQELKKMNGIPIVRNLLSEKM